VKTNLLFFQRGKADKANTKAVWVYDMRANMPAFGKTRLLTVEGWTVARRPSCSLTTRPDASWRTSASCRSCSLRREQRVEQQPKAKPLSDEWPLHHLDGERAASLTRARRLPPGDLGGDQFALDRRAILRAFDAPAATLSRC
jgi:hypothetical protein